MDLSSALLLCMMDFAVLHKPLLGQTPSSTALLKTNRKILHSLSSLSTTVMLFVRTRPLQSTCS